MMLTVFFDLGRIASLGAIFYIVMDMVIHWGVLKHLRKEVQANAFILVTAIFLDAVVLGALLWIKAQSDMMVIYAAIVGMVAVFAGERWFLNGKNNS